MKMKDVIAATGLTDRAIRLYIENGLVLPVCKESYAGSIYLLLTYHKRTLFTGRKKRIIRNTVLSVICIV